MFKLIVLFLLASLVGCTSSRIPISTETCAQISDATEKAACERQLVARTSSTDFPITAFGIGWFSLLWYAGYYVMGVVFGRFIYIDARRRDWLAFRIKPFWWGVMCVFEPAMGALVYWVLHYSRLARRGYA